MTYNVYGYHPLHHKRTKQLIKIIETSDAHIIALQEVKPWFLRQLLHRSEIQHSYHHTSTGKRYNPKGGLFILSKFPIVKSRYIRQPGKRNKMILLTKMIINDKIVPVVNVHLESPLRSKKTRKLQLKKIFRLIRGYHNSIVLGDFNFGDSALESSAIPSSFTDLWLSLKNNRDGYTWDMERNILARKHAYRRENSRRLDRILVHNFSWEPVKVKLTGKRPISLRNRKIYPSDHFALIGTVKSLKR